MQIVVSTHQGKLYDEQIDYVVIRNVDGEYAILKNHVPIVFVIEEGYVKLVKANEVDLFIAINNGFVEFKDNLCNIICQEAFIGKDFEEAQQNIERIRQERIEENKKELVDFTKQSVDLANNLKKAKAGDL